MSQSGRVKVTGSSSHSRTPASVTSLGLPQTRKVYGHTHICMPNWRLSYEVTSPPEIEELNALSEPGRSPICRSMLWDGATGFRADCGTGDQCTAGSASKPRNGRGSPCAERIQGIATK